MRLIQRAIQHCTTSARITDRGRKLEIPIVFVMRFRAKNSIFTDKKLFLVISTPAPLSSGRPESARPSFATAIKDKVGKRKKKQQRQNHDLNDTTLSTAGGGDNDFLENSKYFKKESVRISLFPTQNVSNSCFQSRNNSLKNAI